MDEGEEDDQHHPKPCPCLQEYSRDVDQISWTTNLSVCDVECMKGEDTVQDPPHQGLHAVGQGGGQLHGGEPEYLMFMLELVGWIEATGNCLNNW